jgi:NAD(P)-dependent dehydrogenase (short-subunit alcohol dehydrogenase family)
MYVVITGASTGIGRATALLLSEKGHTVFPSVRTNQDAESLKQQDARLTPIMLDVTDDVSIERAVAFVSQHVADEVVSLVNNAGISVPGPVECLTMEEIREQFDVNFFGVLAVTKAFLPLIRQGEKKGRIVNTGSLNGRMTAPLGSVYCASKFALRSITDGLRMELRPWDIRVSLVEPGITATPILDKTQHKIETGPSNWTPKQRQRYGKAYARLNEISVRFVRFASQPQAVARRMLHALTSDNPRMYYRVGVDAWAAVVIGQLIPGRLSEWLILKMYG